jgi:secreted trypsin-like serine protease
MRSTSTGPLRRVKRSSALALAFAAVTSATVCAPAVGAPKAVHPLAAVHQLTGKQHGDRVARHLTHARVGHGGHMNRRAFAHESIIGGTSAQDGSFPSLAYVIDIQGRYAYQCTGTVVAPNLILTAGHCAEDMRTGVVNKPSGYRVVTGALDPMAPGGSVSTVLGVIVYPGLLRRVDAGDAALLVLSSPVTAPAIALATSSEAGHLQAGSAAVMAGWGITSFDQRLPTERLRSATTVLQGRKWCAANAPPFYPKSELCTITPPSYATGACAGDSGGPLLSRAPAGGEFVQIGIAVHVYGRCSTRRPSVFVSAGSIASWVHTWIDAYKPPPSSPPPPSPAPALEPAPPSPVPLSR